MRSTIRFSLTSITVFFFQHRLSTMIDVLELLIVFIARFFIMDFFFCFEFNEYSKIDEYWFVIFFLFCFYLWFIYERVFLIFFFLLILTMILVVHPHLLAYLILITEWIFFYEAYLYTLILRNIYSMYDINNSELFSHLFFHIVMKRAQIFLSWTIT